VRTVLAAKCQGCHTQPPLHGAPFPLVTYDDTQVLNVTIDERRWELMEIVVGEDFMPPNDPRLNPPPEKLTADEKSQLMTWFAEGAKAVGGTACD
jgi:hypothetical protein